MLNLINKIKNDAIVVSTVIVAIVWTFGILSGRWIAAGLSDAALISVRDITVGKGSVLLMMLRTILPVVLVWLIVQYSKTRFEFVVIFLKALSIGFSTYVFMCAFGSAGWLVAIIVLLIDYINCFVVIVFLLHLHCSQKGNYKRSFSVVLLISFMLAIIDYCIMLPFTISLF